MCMTFPSSYSFVRELKKWAKRQSIEALHALMMGKAAIIPIKSLGPEFLKEHRMDRPRDVS